MSLNTSYREAIAWMEKALGLDVSSTFGSRICTYERYKSESVADALAFLQTKRVSVNFSYIEVETPQCLVGKDIKGVDRM